MNQKTRMSVPGLDNLQNAENHYYGALQRYAVALNAASDKATAEQFRIELWLAFEGLRVEQEIVCPETARDFGSRAGPAVRNEPEPDMA